MRSRRILNFGGVEVVVYLDHALAQRLGPIRRGLTRLLGGGPKPATTAPAPPAPSDTPESRALLEKVATVKGWYQSIDLGHGVETQGFFDHRPLIQHYHLPESMAGMRVLDVATYNGFWAFEFEKRGADEVVAIDIECGADIDLAPARRAQMTEEELRQPTGVGFEIAAEALGSKVNRQICDIYDLSPERIGMFDFVFCGDLLLHLTNPIRALQNIRRVIKPTGCAMLCEMVDPFMRRSGPYLPLNYRGGMHDFIWWTFGQETLEQMIRDAGFGEVETLDRFMLVPRGYEKNAPHVTWRASQPLA